MSGTSPFHVTVLFMSGSQQRLANWGEPTPVETWRGVKNILVVIARLVVLVSAVSFASYAHDVDTR